MRKSRSILLNLPEHQQAKLAEWLINGMTYHTAQELIAKPEADGGFGCRVRSLSAFKPFWEEVCVPILVKRRRQFKSASDALRAEAAANPTRFDQAFIEALQQKAFELCSSPSSNPQEIFFVISQALKVRDQDLKAEQISLAKDKFQFDAAKACLKHLPQLRQIAQQTAASESDKIQQVRQLLFGTIP